MKILNFHGKTYHFHRFCINFHRKFSRKCFNQRQNYKLIIFIYKLAACWYDLKFVEPKINTEYFYDSVKIWVSLMNSVKIWGQGRTLMSSVKIWGQGRTLMNFVKIWGQGRTLMNSVKIWGQGQTLMNSVKIWRVPAQTSALIHLPRNTMSVLGLKNGIKIVWPQFNL